MKLGVGFLLMGIAFRLLFIRSTDVSQELESPFPQETHLPQKAVASEPPAFVEAQEYEEQMQQTGNFTLLKYALFCKKFGLVGSEI